MADAALAKVIEELAQKAERKNLAHVVNPLIPSLADWLRAQDDEPDDRKIYIGFKQKDKDR